jgi:plastocyanin
MGRRAGLGLILFGAAAVAACSASTEPQPSASLAAGAVTVRTVRSESLDSALRFEPYNVSAVAGQAFDLAYVNTDGFPHDVVIAADDGSVAFATDIHSTRGQAIYQVPPLAAGTYQLKCDVHPDMRGVLTVN